MAQEIKRKHKLGKTIQNSNFGQGHSWLFEGEGDPSTGTPLEIQKLSDVNAPIGSNFLDLVTGTSYVKIDSTPNENRGLYKVGVWAAVSGGSSEDNLGQPLESGGHVLNLFASGLDRAVTTSSIPSNTGDVFVLETRFTTTEATSYSISSEGTNGLLIGRFGGDLICGFNGVGFFALSVDDWNTKINGSNIKMIYKRSTGEISVFCNGNKIGLQTDTVTPVTSFFGGGLSVGSRFSPANNFTTGFFDYLRVSIDDVPILDYSFNETSGNTVIDSVGGHDLTIEGSSYTRSEIFKKRDNAINIAIIGDSNAVSRAENTDAPSDLPLDGNINTGAYWNGSTYDQYQLNMNLGGDQGVGRYGVEYRICEQIKTVLGKNTNLMKYALGGSKCTNGGDWDATNGVLTKGFLNEMGKADLTVEAVVVFLGENSATNTSDSSAYEQAQKDLITRIRGSLFNGINTPILLVRLYDFEAANIIAEIPTIQAAHDNIGLTMRNVDIIQPQNVSGVKSDDAHYDGYGIDRLGLEIFKGLKMFL